jgi:hypothetical protein
MIIIALFALVTVVVCVVLFRNSSQPGQPGSGGQMLTVEEYLKPNAVYVAANAVTYAKGTGKCNGIAFDLEGILNPDGRRGDVQRAINRVITALAQYYDTFVWVGGTGGMPEKTTSKYTHVCPMLYTGNRSYPANPDVGNIELAVRTAISRGWAQNEIFLTFQSFSAGYGEGGKAVLSEIVRVANQYPSLAGVVGWPAICDDTCTALPRYPTESELAQKDAATITTLKTSLPTGTLCGGWVMPGTRTRFSGATCLFPGHFLADPFIPNSPIDLGDRPGLRRCIYTVGGDNVGLGYRGV